MADLPIIPAEPTIIPDEVIKGKTYDRYHIAMFVINAADLTIEPSVSVELVKFSVAEDGSKTMLPSSSIIFKVDNIFTKAVDDPILAQVMGGLMDRVIFYGKVAGVIPQ